MQHLKVRDHHREHTWDVGPDFAALAVVNVAGQEGDKKVREEKFAPADSPFSQ
jgi:hypothetical protein